MTSNLLTEFFTKLKESKLFSELAKSDQTAILSQYTENTPAEKLKSAINYLEKLELRNGSLVRESEEIEKAMQILLPEIKITMRKANGAFMQSSESKSRNEDDADASILINNLDETD